MLQGINAMHEFISLYETIANGRADLEGISTDAPVYVSYGSSQHNGEHLANAGSATVELED